MTGKLTAWTATEDALKDRWVLIPDGSGEVMMLIESADLEASSETGASATVHGTITGADRRSAVFYDDEPITFASEDDVELWLREEDRLIAEEGRSPLFRKQFWRRMSSYLIVSAVCCAALIFIGKQYAIPLTMAAFVAGLIVLYGLSAKEIAAVRDRARNRFAHHVDLARR
ncbi:hypothetical protein [Leifsonia sp. Leaf264]|uniref:hypothetical protein n=1 Tax=Leifsonia sp. Leaf264 TaxID=1736314 RepID=UPI0006F48F4E|nr:hypothetical protein [Leifsonia sp. Leaf264]KQO98909.1 hypothetical protein ASF30_12675 [Leifsonia sp. Leaf264]